MKFALFMLVTLLGAKSSAAEGSCACEAEELGFDINCDDQAAMLDALQFLKQSGCATDCSSEECTLNYYIVQAHHDFCPEEGIPEAVEDGFHDYDSTCVACDIERDFVEGAPDCPAPNCMDSSGNDAYVALVEGGCATDCSSSVCRDNFFVLRVTHDLCEHDTLSRAAEEGLHDLERPCVDQICNVGDGQSNQLVCDPHAGHGHGDGAFEWAGVFAVDDSTHVWSMQEVDGEYADPTMRLVLFPTDSPDEEAIHSTEEAAETLIEGDSCTIVEDGESMTPILDAGSCFELHVGSGPDSLFTIETDGISGLAVFAQHVPIEFERDQHYLKDSSGTDIEPIAQEGGGGHGHGHGHGHDDHDDDHSGATANAASGAVAAMLGSIMMVL